MQGPSLILRPNYDLNGDAFDLIFKIVAVLFVYCL